MSCNPEDTITPAKLADLNSNINAVEKYADSDDLTFVTTSGKTKDTIEGKNKKADDSIAIAIQEAGWVFLDEYTNDPTITQYNQFVNFGISPNISRWTVLSNISIPYNIDSTTYPDPSNDPNLRLINEVTDTFVISEDKDRQAAVSGSVGARQLDITAGIFGQDATGIDRIYYDDGTEKTLWYQWTAPTGIITNVTINTPLPQNPNYRLLEVTTTLGAYEFISKQIKDSRGGSAFPTLERSIYPEGWGAVGDNVADDTQAWKDCAAESEISGAEIWLSSSLYKISDEIEIPNSIWGEGSTSAIRPSGQHAAFIIRTGKSGGNQCGRVGNFAIDYQAVPVINSDCIGLWLSKGTAPAAISGNNNVKFSNIFIFSAYRGIQKLSSDLGNLWNVKFENIIVYNPVEYGIYIDATGSNASLNVSFDTVTCDGFASITAKGAFIRGIANLKYYGTATSNTGGNLSAFWASDCTNVDVRLQIEGITVDSPITQGLVGFTNCPTVSLSLTSQLCVFNPGVGNSAYYVYLDANVDSFVFSAFSDLGDSFPSGETIKVNVNSGTGNNTKITAIEPSLSASDFFASPDTINNTKFQTTNYALEKTSTTRRVFSNGVSAPANTLTDIISTQEYSGVVNKPSGLYLIQGRFAGDSSIGFTDLVIVYSAGPALQSVSTIDSNFFGADHPRSYSINNANLAVTITHPSSSYTINATGVDQVGA